MSAAIFTSGCGVTPAAGNVPIAKFLTSPREDECGCQMDAQAIPASVFLASDF
jgi:hypothetical protein